ncbi:hypothetical protein D3C71_2031430 [compost metagenome]
MLRSIGDVVNKGREGGNHFRLQRSMRGVGQIVQSNLVWCLADALPYPGKHQQFKLIGRRLEEWL